MHTCIVDNSGEAWTTTELDEANLNQVYNQYRIKYGIPFPEEIRDLRKYYGLSAARMSEILGFGTNQYRNYENGEIPSVSNARTLIAIRDKDTFLEFLEASKTILGEREYSRLKKRINDLREYSRSDSIPSELSGYVSLSTKKIASAVEFFIKELGGVFVTKMNKLLFYADFLCFCRCAHGITGLRYLAMQYGPVPDNWGKIYDAIPDVDMNEFVFPDMTTGIRLESDTEPDMDIFEENEIQVLRDVAQRFRNVNAGEISNISHKEKGWMENKSDKGYIDYSYAFELSIGRD